MLKGRTGAAARESVPLSPAHACGGFLRCRPTLPCFENLPALRTAMKPPWTHITGSLIESPEFVREYGEVTLSSVAMC